MDLNIFPLDHGELWSLLFFLEYLSLALSEALINIDKNHKSEGDPTSDYQNHHCHQISEEEGVVKMIFLFS